jgi:pSer/pThr/pTyr-binding forkhead associated (FHA) protein
MIGLRVRGDGDLRSYDYRFDRSEVLVGRSDRADVQLPRPTISLFHLRLRREGETFWATDLDSANGSWIDGEPLVPGHPRVVDPGSTIEIGSKGTPGSGGFALEVLDPAVTPAEATAPQTTASFARQMVRQVIEGLAPAAELAWVEVVRGPNHGLRLDLAPRSEAYAIGRGEACDLVLSDADASRAHLALTVDEQGTWARDLGSKNGLTVNGLPCGAASRLLCHGDELQVGQTRLRFGDPTGRFLAALQGEELGDGSSPASLVEAGHPCRGKAPEATRQRQRGELLIWLAGGLLVLGAALLIAYLVR